MEDERGRDGGDRPDHEGVREPALVRSLSPLFAGERVGVRGYYPPTAQSEWLLQRHLRYCRARQLFQKTNALVACHRSSDGPRIASAADSLCCPPCHFNDQSARSRQTKSQMVAADRLLPDKLVSIDLIGCECNSRGTISASVLIDAQASCDLGCDFVACGRALPCPSPGLHFMQSDLSPQRAGRG